MSRVARNRVALTFSSRRNPTHGMTFIEELRIRSCKKVRNGPDLFASNYELALVAYGQVFGMRVLLGIGLGIDVRLILEGTPQLMSSNTRLFRVRRD